MLSCYEHDNTRQKHDKTGFGVSLVYLAGPPSSHIVDSTAASRDVDFRTRVVKTSTKRSKFPPDEVVTMVFGSTFGFQSVAGSCASDGPGMRTTKTTKYDHRFVRIPPTQPSCQPKESFFGIGKNPRVGRWHPAKGTYVYFSTKRSIQNTPVLRSTIYHQNALVARTPSLALSLSLSLVCVATRRIFS